MGKQLVFVENGKRIENEDRLTRVQEQLDAVSVLFKSGELGEVIAKVFLQSKVKRPMNKWSVYNRLGIFISGGTDARGFRQWEAVGREVKPERRANPYFFILTPLFNDGKFKLDKNGKRIPKLGTYGKFKGRQVYRKGKPQWECYTYLSGFRVVSVWDVSETTLVNEALWLESTKEDEDLLAWIAELPLKEVALFLGVDHVEIYEGENSGAYGYFTRTGQIIGLGVQDLQTWFHEMVHAAEFALGELQKHKVQDPFSEAVAELGAIVLLFTLGLQGEADPKFAYDYIEHYAEQEELSVDIIIKKVTNRMMTAVGAILEIGELISNGEDISRFAKFIEAETKIVEKELVAV